jgi:hypothetical protein
VLLLDGGSGAGKSVLADDISAAWAEARGEALQVVRLDDVYPGWFGLAAASAAVTGTILRAADPGYRRWDWGCSGLGGGCRSIPAGRSGRGLRVAHGGLGAARPRPDLAEPRRAGSQGPGAGPRRRYEPWGPGPQERRH